MAGYGNVNAPDLSPSDLESQHAETRFGRDDAHPYSNPHDTYGSGTTGGAGFGNKSAPDPTSLHDDHATTRFGSHSDTAPYSGGTHHGSGSTGGAGWGNKTGRFSESHDSALGKVLEKVGHAVGNQGLAEKGYQRRVSAGFAKGEEEGAGEAR